MFLGGGRVPEAVVPVSAGVCSMGCVGVSVSTPVLGCRCLCRSGATVWQLLNLRAPTGEGTGLNMLPLQTLGTKLLWRKYDDCDRF